MLTQLLIQENQPNESCMIQLASYIVDGLVEKKRETHQLFQNMLPGTLPNTSKMSEWFHHVCIVESFYGPYVICARSGSK